MQLSVFFAGVAVVLTCVLYQQNRTRRLGALTLTHLYVGQGDATLVTFPNGAHWLVDGGGAVLPHAQAQSAQQLVAALRQEGVARIDVMLLTHPHPDHYGGLLAAAKIFRARALWLGDDYRPQGDVRTLVQALRALGAGVALPPSAGEVAGVQFRVLRPLAHVAACANDHSLGLHLTFKRRTALLVGDMEGRAESLLGSDDVRAEVLKVGHHGSKTSCSTRFLAKVQPKVAIVSCGENNAFSFPHPEVLSRLSKAGISIISLADVGTTRLVTRGDTWSLSSANAPSIEPLR